MVYVDSLFDTKGNWKYKEACHLTADTESELIAFALKIGLRKEWLQSEKPNHIHFDLSASRRAVAVKMGAVEI